MDSLRRYEPNVVLRGPVLEAYSPNARYVRIRGHLCVALSFCRGINAQGIKRAFQIKDFDSVIPGHGGLMDRLDCQLIMAMYTRVHFVTWVRAFAVTVPTLMRSFMKLPHDRQLEVRFVPSLCNDEQPNSIQSESNVHTLICTFDYQVYAQIQAALQQE